MPEVHIDRASQGSVSENRAVSLNDAPGYLKDDNFLLFTDTEEQVQVRDPA